MEIKFSLTELIPQESRVLVNENGFLTIGLQRSSKKTILPAEIKVSRDIGWLIGFWHAEGRKGSKKHYTVGVSNSSLQLVKFWIKILQNQIGFRDNIPLEIRPVGEEFNDLLFNDIRNLKISYGMNASYKYTKTHYRVEISSKVLYDILTKIFQLAKDNKEFRIGYVAGFFDGDGYVSKEGYIDIRLEKNEFSRKCYELIKLALNEEGFPVKEYLKSQYRIQIIRKKFSKKFSDTFPLLHDFKIKRLNSS